MPKKIVIDDSGYGQSRLKTFQPQKTVLNDSGYGQSRLKTFKPAVEPAPEEYKKGGKVKRKRKAKTKYAHKQKQTVYVNINNSRKTVKRNAGGGTTQSQQHHNYSHYMPQIVPQYIQPPTANQALTLADVDSRIDNYNKINQ